MAEFVQLTQFVARSEALIARGVLEANDILAFVPELFALSANPELVFARSGYRLMVPDDQIDEAQSLLEQIEAASARGEFSLD